MSSAIGYPGTSWLVARTNLIDLRKHTVPSIFEVANIMGLPPDEFRYNAQDNIFNFKNGSRIIFASASYIPNDPMFERFGSMQNTGGWIEEGGEIHEAAYENIKISIGRWKNEEYGLPFKLLITANPKKNWMYRIAKHPESTQRFIPALAKDNHFLPEGYQETLAGIKDQRDRQRLLLGIWDYEDDPTVLIEHHTIENLFTNTHVRKTGKKYIICDVARFGKDRSVFSVWDGLVLTELLTVRKADLEQQKQIINGLRVKHQIPASNLLVDESGVGGGLVDSTGAVGFIGNAKPSDEGFKMLKDECGYKLAELAPSIFIEADTSNEVAEKIRIQLGQLKTYDSDRDSKVRILPKEKIIEQIGESPDYLDIFIMRMFFERQTGFVMGGFARK